MLVIRSLWGWLMGDERRPRLIPCWMRDLSDGQIYQIGMLITYGFSAAKYPHVTPTEGNITWLVSIGSAIAWPLFWSWEFFSWIV